MQNWERKDEGNEAGRETSRYKCNDGFYEVMKVRSMIFKQFSECYCVSIQRLQ